MNSRMRLLGLTTLCVSEPCVIILRSVRAFKNLKCTLPLSTASFESFGWSPLAAPIKLQSLLWHSFHASFWWLFVQYQEVLQAPHRRLAGSPQCSHKWTLGDNMMEYWWHENVYVGIDLWLCSYDNVLLFFKPKLNKTRNKQKFNQNTIENEPSSALTCHSLPNFQKVTKHPKYLSQYRMLNKTFILHVLYCYHYPWLCH